MAQFLATPAGIRRDILAFLEQSFKAALPARFGQKRSFSTEKLWGDADSWGSQAFKKSTFLRPM